MKHLGPASWPDGSRAARVRYHGLVEEDDPTQALEETVALATLRPEPPPHDAAAFAADLLPGVRASVYDAEVCSWEGVLVLSAVPAAGAKYRSAAYRVRRVDGDATVDLSQLRPMWDCYEKRGSAKQPGWWNRTAQDAKVARKQEARAGRRGGGAAAGAGAAGAGGAAGTSAAGAGAMPGVAQEASCSSEQTAEAAGEEAPRPPPLPPPPPLQPHDDDEDDSDESEMVAEEVEVEVEQQEPPPDAHGGPPPPAPPPQAAPPPPIPPPVPPPAPPPPVAHGSAACPIVLE